MSGHQIGYVRVSSTDQNEARQLADIELNKVFTDKCSGGTRQRPALAECLEWCREGDTLHVHSIDRLARDLADLQAIVGELTAKGVAVVFVKENLTFSGDTSNPMNTLMLQMMGAFAQFERSMIKERQREGIAAARKAGKQIGAKPKLSADQIVEIKELLAAGETKKAVAEKFGITRPTLYKAIA
jgi:DNA invertase Pin-like site-specific DNA recombinase